MHASAEHLELTPTAAGRRTVGAVERWSLMVVVLVGSMLPWYTLRTFPLIAVRGASINLLDALVGWTTLLAIPGTVRRLRERDPAVLWVCALLAYMIIPFAMGMRDPAARFAAVREARPLAFYGLALAFIVSGCNADDFRRFRQVYVVGAVIAMAAVFAHIRWHLPLPGYQDLALNAPFSRVGFLVSYVELTVLPIAMLFALDELLSARAHATRFAWALAVAVVAWYVLARGERAVQALTAGVAFVVWRIRSAGHAQVRYAVVIAIALGAMIVLGLGVLPAPHWIAGPTRYTLDRWLRWRSDNSLRFRITELALGLPRIARNPLFGEGLGGVVLSQDPLDPGHPWRYIASGYGFLLIKTGLIGFGLYVAMAVAAIRRAWVLRRTAAGRAGARAACIGLIGIALLLALNVVHTVADIPEGAIAFSLFYGMIMAPAVYSTFGREVS
jgi:hypothetical protein